MERSKHSNSCPRYMIGSEPDFGDECTCGMKAKESWRANFVPAPHFFDLNQACVVVNEALDGFGCYLVGSATNRRDFRDVDVRYIMDDAKYDAMFHSGGGVRNPLWSLMSTAVSAWLSKQSGLPVDFQIQKQSEANASFSRKDGHDRQPLGIFYARSEAT